MFSIHLYSILGIMIWACGFVNGYGRFLNDFVECNGESCEYPNELIESQDVDKLKDTLRTSRFKRHAYPDSSFLVEQSLCKSRIQTINPRKLKALDGEIKTIVNHGKYKQEVRTEICE